ncbi:hypothetical protein ACFRNT_33030, partial [Streptomyces sp. NPDC056697]
SKQVFHAIDHFAWRRITKWIYHKHSRLTWRQVRRRFCLPGTWKIAHSGVVFTGASIVRVTRYLYRGSKIPTPWPPNPAVVEMTS